MADAGWVDLLGLGRKTIPVATLPTWDVVAGQTYVDGAVAGQAGLDGAVVGEVYRDGAVAGQTEPS